MLFRSLTRHEAGFAEESLGPVRFVPLVEGEAQTGKAQQTAIEAAVSEQRTIS